MIPVSLYCDVDGVLANFKRYMEKAMNIHCSESNPFPNVLWKKIIPACPTLFRDLQPMPDCYDLWRPLQALDKANVIRLSLLTASPDGWEESRQHKREWCAKYLGPQYPVFVVSRAEKQKFARDHYGLPCILIDDSPKNIAEWEAAGGIPVFHSDAKDSIKQVKKALKTHFNR